MLNNLHQFTGTEAYHKLSAFGRFNCTDGVKYVAVEGKAFWLIDAIASYQSKLKNIELQAWTITPNKTGTGAILTCTDGNEKVLVKQSFSSCSINQKIDFYLTDGVLMLTSEY